jgi:glycosyltransferase involved in cell wall biosynthesis
MTVKVSIGICVKNCEKTIRKAMQSVINQDFPDEKMEIIVVDDKSKDRTIPIIQNVLLNTNIKRRIFHNVGNGLGRARQTVIENASGKYVLWIDGDIVISNDYVRKQVEFMDSHPNVASARGRWGRCQEKNLVAILENMKAVYYYNFRKNGGVTRKLLGIAGCIQRIKALKEVGGFDTQIEGAGEDIDILIRMRKAGWLLCITKPVFYHEEIETWKELSDRYRWYGYAWHYLAHKYKNLGPIWKKIPPVSFVKGIYDSIRAYKLTYSKLAFLLPLQYFFKRSFWILGYIQSHLNDYGHFFKHTPSR